MQQALTEHHTGHRCSQIKQKMTKIFDFVSVISAGIEESQTAQDYDLVPLLIKRQRKIPFRFFDNL